MCKICVLWYSDWPKRSFHLAEEPMCCQWKPWMQTLLCSSLPDSAGALEIREMAPASDLVLVHVQGTVSNSWKKWNWTPPGQIRSINKVWGDKSRFIFIISTGKILRGDLVLSVCFYPAHGKTQEWENGAVPVSSQLRGCAYLIVNIYKAFCKWKLKWRAISHYCITRFFFWETSLLCFSHIRDKQLLANISSYICPLFIRYQQKPLLLAKPPLECFLLLANTSPPHWTSSGKVKITSNLLCFAHSSLFLKIVYFLGPFKSLLFWPYSYFSHEKKYLFPSPVDIISLSLSFYFNKSLLTKKFQTSLSLPTSGTAGQFPVDTIWLHG